MLIGHMSASAVYTTFAWIYVATTVLTIVAYVLSKPFSKFIVMGATGAQIFTLVWVVITLYADSWCEGWLYYL